MTDAEKKIKALNQLLGEALDMADKALKLSKKSLIQGIYLGVTIAYATVLLAKWYYS